MIRKKVKPGQWVFLTRWLILLAWALPSHAVIETYEFENPEQEARYQHFTEVLRCPKCQNQNLAGSDSPIASDLRRELALQIRGGKADDEIIDFMVARFGDFVLYDPPFKKNTWLLWLMPIGLLLAGLLIVILLLRRRAGNPVVETSAQSSLPISADGLSKRNAIFVLGIAGVVVLVSAASLYHRYGAGEALAISRLANAFYEEAAKAGAEQREVNPALVRELLERLQKAGDKKTEGNDLQLLYLQGSLHAYLSEFEQAIPYYKEYLMAMPTDERVLTEYVQILYLAAGRELSERVQFVVGRALALNPHNQEVLSLLAMHHFERGEFKQAVNYWRQILAAMPADDPGRPLIERAISAARGSAGKG